MKMNDIQKSSFKYSCILTFYVFILFIGEHYINKTTNHSIGILGINWLTPLIIFYITMLALIWHVAWLFFKPVRDVQYKQWQSEQEQLKREEQDLTKRAAPYKYKKPTKRPATGFEFTIYFILMWLFIIFYNHK